MSRPLLLLVALALGAPTLSHAGDDPDPAVERPMIEALQRREAGILDRLRALNPDKHDALMVLKATDRRAYLRALVKIARMMDGMNPEVPPELLEAKTELEAIRQAHPDGFEALPRKEARAVRAEVTGIAERIFEIKQQLRRDKIAQLREALSDLEEDVARRDEDRDALIDTFVDRWLQGPVDL